MKKRVPFSPEVESAIRAIRANMGPRKTQVFDRRLEWGGAIVKQNGETWIVTETGAIHREES